MTPDDAVLTYTAQLARGVAFVFDSHGCHILPVTELGYGADLDDAVGRADHAEMICAHVHAEILCAHDRRFVTTLRAGGWTDTAIADALQVPASALPTAAAVNLLDDLTRVAQRVSA